MLLNYARKSTLLNNFYNVNLLRKKKKQKGARIIVREKDAEL